MSAPFQPQRALGEFLRSGRAAETSVAVLGDIVLDRYLTGSTRRVSREAPIPVVVCDTRAAADNLGGAGNVAANLRGIGCRVWLAGMVGDDAFGQKVRGHVQSFRIEPRLWPRRTPTLVKTRLICGGQQLARFDFEDVEPLPPEGVENALAFLSKAIDGGVRTVILSDYGLGYCTPELCHGVISMAAERGAHVLVDPRGVDWSKYRGAALATPNLGELSATWGRHVRNDPKTVAEVGEKVRRKNGLKWLLVTRSSRGMTLLGPEAVRHIRAHPVEVFDVSGAGDTVIAMLAALNAAGFDAERASCMANEAAQFVITRSGTYAFTARDYLEAYRSRTPYLFSPVAEVDAAVRQVRAWQSAGQRVIFTNGCFDVLHAGHLDSLRRARLLGDRLVVGLNSDRSVRALKGPSRPVNPQDLRAELLAALRPVDMVVVFDEDTPRELLSRLRPDVLAKGGDYRAEELPGREFVDEVVILPLLEGHSTTRILNHGREGGGQA